jgi:hypothetical protein
MVAIGKYSLPLVLDAHLIDHQLLQTP